MSVVSDGSGILAFVSRAISGDVMVEAARYNKKTQELEKFETPVKEPVIVFFPSGACQIMPLREVQRRGFDQQPTVLNFQAVVDNTTLAGRYKFAMDPGVRRHAWRALEDVVISLVTSKTGSPLPEGCSYSKKSLFEELAQLDELEDA